MHRDGIDHLIEICDVIITDVHMSKESQSRSVAVIGAGVVGLSVAVELQRRGCRVTVFDRDGPMNGCSAGNAGYLSEANIFPPATPEILWQLPALLFAKQGPLVIRPSYLHKLVPWALHSVLALRTHSSSAITGALAGLTRAAYPSILGLARHTCASGFLSRDGGLIAFKTRPALDRKARLLEQWRSHGLRVEVLSAEEVLALEPALSPDIAGGLFFPNAGRCSDPHALGMHYVHHLVSHGAKMEFAPVRATVLMLQIQPTCF
jgi:D-amino-acid dehydrogenase